MKDSHFQRNNGSVVPFPGKERGLDGGGGGPHDPSMESRVKKLEEDLHAAKIDLAVIRSNYATKADISEAKNSIIMWVVSAILLAQVIPALLKKLGL